ncbi:Hypothetical predicted protein [Mytilus galloprovincialis]|uniref:Reverse transcriptase domain-containing protein n=1 Tax=Mytilus galloprovincialis TaxID=29158 RepID=A0A8B6G109_MYTGA|nr:Hypothetical predicted protein [Mytilus galloprovincialis]
MEAITNAGKKTIPTKLLQTKGPKWKASPEVLIILNACREIYKKWQSVGKTKDHVLAIELKKEKKKLRSKLRAEQALDRQKLYQQIIDNPNTQLFYRLINRGRNNNRTTTNCLKTNGEYMFLPEEKVPTSFKSGILTPVLIKDKDSTELGNYRGITVTPVTGKTFEYYFLTKLNLESKTDLQFGFTKGLSPIMASLIISEARYEEKKGSEKFFINILDVKSAFDVVQHYILMDKMIDQDIHPVYWKILTELYNDLTSKVKWLDGISTPFNIKQGVRQGGILSTHLYKVFVQDLLVELEENALGYHLGNVYAGTPTCADDIAFISNNKNELQIILNVLSRYANEHHYTIHPRKTQIIDCSKTKSNFKWNLGEINIRIS